MNETIYASDPTVIATENTPEELSTIRRGSNPGNTQAGFLEQISSDSVVFGLSRSGARILRV